MNWRSELEAIIGAVPPHQVPDAIGELERARLLLTRRFLDEPDRDGAPGDVPVDLRVEEVAEMFGRSPQRIRDWLRAGELDGYKLHGKEWRVTRAAFREFQERQRDVESGTSTSTGRRGDMGAWRRHLKTPDPGDGDRT